MGPKLRCVKKGARGAIFKEALTLRGSLCTPMKGERMHTSLNVAPSLNSPHSSSASANRVTT